MLSLQTTVFTFLLDWYLPFCWSALIFLPPSITFLLSEIGLQGQKTTLSLMFSSYLSAMSRRFPRLDWHMLFLQRATVSLYWEGLRKSLKSEVPWRISTIFCCFFLFFGLAKQSLNSYKLFTSKVWGKPTPQFTALSAASISLQCRTLPHNTHHWLHLFACVYLLKCKVPLEYSLRFQFKELAL